MKTIIKILPDVLAALGTICIVGALWMVSPALGLGALGVGAILWGVLLTVGGGSDP